MPATEVHRCETCGQKVKPTELRRCRVCDGLIKLGPKNARTNRRYCSNACRASAHRARQDRARALYMENQSFYLTAVELGVTAASVERWVTGSKK